MKRWARVQKKPLSMKFGTKQAVRSFGFPRSMGKILDVRDDPLELEELFAMSKTFVCNPNNRRPAVPVPDFVLTKTKHAN